MKYLDKESVKRNEEFSMKLDELVSKLDRSRANEEYVNLEDLCDVLNICGNTWDIEAYRLKEYGVLQWTCTDEWVGYTLMLLDDEPIAFTYRGARKEYKFISVEATTIIQCTM